ncbi:MAG: nucleoside monophosphate kinase [Patescibacteria group bacterium]
MPQNQKNAVILFGPPGAGKTTQANYISAAFGLAHIDSGRLIERTVHDPALENDPAITRERNLFDSGILNTPEWVADLILSEIRKIHATGSGIVFSGSPRTLYEGRTLVPILAALYGPENLLFIKIAISGETSLFRNTHRLICEKCGRIYQSFAGNPAPERCSCGGRIVPRILDTEEAIKVRLDQYQNRTAPLFQFLSERGYVLNEIDGERAPDVIAAELEKVIRAKFDA